MSLLEVLQLIGYTTGAALHLWMGALLLKRRRSLGKIERVLLLLAFGIGVWHASNLLLTLHALLGLTQTRWSFMLRLADSVSVISITLSYSFLLHVHLYLWAGARRRTLTFTERVRIYLSYIPSIFLFMAVPRLWEGVYAPMFVKLADLVLPFAVWACYVLALIALTDFLIAKNSSSKSERWQMRTLAAAFLVIGFLILAVYGFGLGEGTLFGAFLKTIANLGSLLPTALIAYYIYRYRYLELIIKESLVLASFAVAVLAIYLYGIRTVGEWLTLRYSLRPGAVESLLILTLALAAAPLRRWLEKRFHELFEREASLYRDVVSRIGAHAGQYKQLPELLRFVEERTEQGLGLRRVTIVPVNIETGVPNNEAVEFENEHGADERARSDFSVWAKHVLEIARARGWAVVEDEPTLRERNYDAAYALRREDETLGLMLVDAKGEALIAETRAVLEVLAGQVAIAIQDCRLVEENVRLERRLAQGERLAALGQMAAAVAHEVKNPLSAIKSIAQVMREDESLSHEYARDLNLIVGETDRLSRSVSQLLSFARHAPPSVAPGRADEIVRAVIELFRAEANVRGIRLECRAETQTEIDGAISSALRDALSNLLLNALQATPAGGRVTVEADLENDSSLLIFVADSGAGVPAGLREKIWEPFFTTRQRGTGLGLAIVRKRIEEAGGSARLATSGNGEGARFELRLPVERD